MSRRPRPPRPDAHNVLDLGTDKVCSACDHRLPWTSEYFHRKRQRDGSPYLSSTCRWCRSRQRRRNGEWSSDYHRARRRAWNAAQARLRAAVPELWDTIYGAELRKHGIERNDQVL